jgi:hypothetical protein
METPPDPRDTDRATWVKSMALYSAVVADLLGYTGAGIALGYLAWAKLGLPWWVLLLSSLAGFSLAMYRLYSQFIKMK